MFVHEHKLRVRYSETDKMGYMYYGHAAQYYEVARAEAVRTLGISYQAMEDDIHVMMPVMALQVRYVRPAYYDDLLTIRTEVRQMPTNKMVFHHEVFNEKGKLLQAGEVKLAFVHSQTGKRCEAPEYLLEKVRPYFE